MPVPDQRSQLDEWGEFLLAHSKFKTASTFKDTLRRRMLNLVERGYIDREGNTYTITARERCTRQRGWHRLRSVHISRC